MLKTALRNREAMSVPIGADQPPSTDSHSPWLTTKTMLKMKFTLFFILLTLLQAQAEGFSQTVNFSGRKVGLTKVFEVVESQTGYSVFANKNLLKETRSVSISVKNMPLKEFLDIIFRDQPVSYEINNKTIFLKKKVLAPASTVKGEEQRAAFQTITGTIVDSSGAPLAGASITIKGTNISATTNDAGQFRIEAEPNQTLVISFIGYQVQELPLNGRTNVEIILKKQVAEMEQVVVTALGITRKTKALSYSVQEIKGDEVVRVKDANFVNSLVGKVAGITINNSAAGIGGSARVVMRGTKSLFGNNNALYVIDGIPLPNLTTTQASDIFTGSGASGDGISNLNPDDIASMSVLTGSAAAALYGSQAANGVVLITTKRGVANKTSVTVANNTNFFNPLILPEFQNTYGSAPGDYYSWGPKLNTPSTYKPSDFFQTGYNVTNSVSLATGSDKNQTYLSAATVNAEGIVPNNGLARYNFSVRNTSSFLDDRMTLDVSGMYIKVNEDNMLSQGQYFNPLVPIYLFPLGDDIERYKVFERYNPARNFNTQFWPYGDLGFQMQNPYWIINRNLFENAKDRFVLSTGLKYNINSWLNIAGRVKLDHNTSVNERKFYASTSGLFASDAGAYNKNTAVTKQLYADVLLNANKNFGTDYTLNATIGSSLLDTRYDQEGYGGNLLGVPNLFAYQNVNLLQSTVTQNRFRDQLQAVFGTAQIGYRNMLFVDVTARNDWASALANTTAKSVFYPSVGVSGILSDLFNLRSNIVSFVKVRGTYSEVGNAPERFVSRATNQIVGSYPTPITFMPIATLRPERTKSFEAGLNLRFLKNKINFDVSAYQSRTFNQLFNPALASSTGFLSAYINAGEVLNRGIEASLGANLKIGKLDWTSTVTFGMNRNRIEQLLNDYIDPITNTPVKGLDSLNMGGTGSFTTALVKGGSMGDIYVNSLAVDEHGYINVGLVSQTVTADNSRFLKAGNSNPRYNIGFRNGFAYKNFNFDFLINARLGGEVVSITQAIMDRFGVSKTSADARDAGGVVINGERIPAQPYYSVTGGGVAGVGSMYVYSASNLRLAEASLSYTFPGTLFNNKIKGITIGVNGRNLFLLTKAPFDPETAASTGTYYQGIDYFIQPSLRSFGFSTRIQF
ncbi:SusC/RagA family TonB-linked outer membrane protein [Terrimonas sp. NA20]|uniref:SusC/RagA family TonB-linked outer membrane protein n=1 Tax=Terrimonas ginsenosidimutans TaxID=2908004 RepID=A0ABS9KSM1_9BACT|nr:SusC/RagA family TonB-linked outer membrane protein [Terrimonas ginsenosidimutans]MCG2615327.1 SusC/RagA family TonB-linked outer membrane protein [Terrimonas ginsenosidimutans]